MAEKQEHEVGLKQATAQRRSHRGWVTRRLHETVQTVELRSVEERKRLQADQVELVAAFAKWKVSVDAVGVLLSDDEFDADQTEQWAVCQEVEREIRRVDRLLSEGTGEFAGELRGSVAPGGAASVGSEGSERAASVVGSGSERAAASQATPLREGAGGLRSVRLPKLELKDFRGDPLTWYEWIQNFEVTVGASAISNAEKFAYLSSYLKGEAEESIRGITRTNENYEVALARLRERFGKPKRVKDAVYRKLREQPVLQAEDHQGLRRLVDDLQVATRSLMFLGVDSQELGGWFVSLIEPKLPQSWRLQWARALGADDEGDLDSLLVFLEQEAAIQERARCSGLQLKGDSSGVRIGWQPNSRSPGRVQTPRMTTAAALVGHASGCCVFCEGTHEPGLCDKTGAMSDQSKRRALIKAQRCFKCLSAGHRSRNCRRSPRCQKCEGAHATVMCRGVRRTFPEARTEELTATVEDTLAVISAARAPSVRLQMLRAEAQGPRAQQGVRVLFDSASHYSYVTREVAGKLELEFTGPPRLLKHGLFGGHEVEAREHQQVRLVLASAGYKCSITALVIDKICGTVDNCVRLPPSLKKLGIELSGGGLGTVDVLLGADVLGALLTGQVHRSVEGLVAIQYKLGWVVTGREKSAHHEVESLAQSCISLITQTPDAFWRLDLLGIEDPGHRRSEEERGRQSQEHFDSTTRVVEGRFEVRLPYKEWYPTLPSYRNVAESRLRSTTARLKDRGLLEQYDGVFKDWEKEGVIEEVPSDDEETGHYIPHRPVIKESSTTTKIRPVFDASTKSKATPSLNDCLETGENLILRLSRVLMEFRMREFGVIGDIRKAFLQIGVHKADRDVLRFLWWKTLDCEEIRVMRHRRVVFGVTSSPFHLAAALQHILRAAPQEMAQTTLRLASGFYVDNVVTSVDSPYLLKRFVEEASQLLASYGFEIRDWEEASQIRPARSPLLGLVWDRVSDTLACETTALEQRAEASPSVTKRTILSVAQAVFDPVGHTAPATVKLKILLQHLWKDNVGWDETVEESIARVFRRWLKEVGALKSVEVPRWIGRGLRTLHVFCDASQAAYAAVVFVRTESAEGVQVHLLAVKVRVAPLSDMTIPRLELMGCLIATRLADEVKTTPEFDHASVMFWTDSTVARAWIQQEGRVWTAFVGNRVKEIRQRSATQDWRHVPGEGNPADLPSRGCFPQTLADSSWWLGPSWLRENPNDWPPDDAKPDNLDEVYRERKRGPDLLSLVTQAKEERNCVLELGEKRSSFRKIVRVVGWIRRWRMNLGRDLGEQLKGTLTVRELQEAEEVVWARIQHEQFSEELLRLQAGEPVPPTSRLFALRPFLGTDGLVRSRTRVLEAEDSEEFRLPIVVADCRLLDLKVLDVHRELLHAGTSTVLAQLRENMWILQGRRNVRRILRTCGRCRRFNTRPLTAEEPPLPRQRLQTDRPFGTTGVDLAGPLYLRPAKKTARQQKVWVVLFTCAVYRAVHLEAVQSLSTASFLIAFRRFVTRRGRPTMMWSDNGTNFIGAIRAFRGSLFEQPIVWRLNPPAAPWWGGFWERLVRSLKDALRKVVGNALLTEVELHTVLCEVEGVVNARPLTRQTEDPDDMAVLTPAMFLGLLPGRTYAADLPQADNADRQLKGRAAYRVAVSEALRRRFRVEYLGALRTRGARVTRAPQVGEVGLLGSDGSRRLEWPLCRIEAVFPGRDGVIRTIRVRMPGRKSLLRPVQRFHWLETTTIEEGLNNVAPAASEGEVDDPDPELAVEPTLEGMEQAVVTRGGRRIRLPVRLRD